MTQPDEAFQKGFDAGLTRRILRYIRPYLRLVGVGLTVLYLPNTLSGGSNNALFNISVRRP